MRIFIIGVNGFIGNALTRAVLEKTDYAVTGIDIEKDRIEGDVLDNTRFEFYHGDISISREWVEFQVKRSDVVIPLAAVAIPKVYVDDPLFVFELDFKENLKIIELVSRYSKRLIFPSTSEVYGMCDDEFFDEQTSNLTLGPINKHRWIYSSGKQLLDRVIHAHGLQRDLRYTLFRPFNWIGPHLDRIEEKKIGSSRVLTEFIARVVYNEPLYLVDGGIQKRCFLDLQDGIEALLRILENKDNCAEGQIFNLGNPDNEVSIKQLADLVIDAYQQHPRSRQHPFGAGTQSVDSDQFYGTGYQDVDRRRPSIVRASERLSWTPEIGIETSVCRTVDSFIQELESS